MAQKSLESTLYDSAASGNSLQPLQPGSQAILAQTVLEPNNTKSVATHCTRFSRIRKALVDSAKCVHIFEGGRRQNEKMQAVPQESAEFPVPGDTPALQ